MDKHHMNPLFRSAVACTSVLVFSLGCGLVHAQTGHPTPPPASTTASVSVVPLPQAPQTAPKDSVPGAFSAMVIADKEATLSAQMAGKINKINYSIGQEFRAGSVLVAFDCAEPQAKLDALNAEYLGARETHLAKLKLQGLGAAGDLEVTLAAAAAEKAKSLVNQQQAQMNFCNIRAPYAGRLVRLKARQAENVAPNQPIIEIVATAKLKATVHVPLSQAIQLTPGAVLSIEIKDTGRKYPASVTKLNGRVDGVSQSLEIETEFVGNTAGLLPGMIGEAVFSAKAGKTN